MGPLDEAMMRRAIAAAMETLGRTRPNPTVGCVIARGDAVLAVAATAPTGRPHAEEQALDVAGDSAAGADCYVTLEPCGVRTSGGTSCSQRLVDAGVRRVMIACEDISPGAAGQGIERLRAAGIAVELGLLAGEADVLSAGFRHRLATGRPMVELADGPATFEGRFEAPEDADLGRALEEYARKGYSRLWTPRGGNMAQRLAALGWLGRGPGSAKR